MTEIRFTLVADGSSDAVLVRILTWLIGQHARLIAANGVFADLSHLPRSRRSLADRIDAALTLYRCDLLFIHRDAERESPQLRRDEIEEARRSLRQQPAREPVPVIPVRMTEAWLLFDIDAIRRASGNPNGKVSLGLPKPREIEDLPDPKDTLHRLLIAASELTGRRKKDFSTTAAKRRIVELVDDFSPLRQLPAFQALERDVQSVLKSWIP